MRTVFHRVFLSVVIFFWMFSTLHVENVFGRAEKLVGRAELQTQVLLPTFLDEVPEAQEESSLSILLLLPVPELEMVIQKRQIIDFPQYYNEQAKPVLRQLQALQEQGKIVDYSEDMEAFAIRVQLAAGLSDDELPAFPGVQVVEEHAREAADSCVIPRAEMVKDILKAAKASMAIWDSPEIRRNQELTSGAPTINVYISSYVTYGTRYASISGEVAPDISVKIVVKSPNGSVVVDQTVTSWNTGSGGSYFLSPEYQGCEGYGWSISAGQTITVTAAGKTSTFQVPMLEGEVLPEADKVIGKTAASRKVQAGVLPTYSTCQSSSYTRETISGADGTFQFDLSASGGIDRSGGVTLFVYDVNNNFLYYDLHVPRIVTYGDYAVWTNVSKPRIVTTISILRGQTEIERVVENSDTEGDVIVYPSNRIIPGDIIRVEADGKTMQFTKAPVTNIQFDLVNGRFSARTAPGLTIKGNVWPEYDACPHDSSCDAKISNVSGDFILNLSSSSIKRSEVDVSIYDNNGNRQFDSYRMPFIEYETYFYSTTPGSSIYGEWTPGPSQLTGHIKNGSTVEQTFTIDLYNGWYHKNLGQMLPNGYQIEVTDGVLTKQLVVQEVTVRHDSVNNVVVGTVPLGGWVDIVSYFYYRYYDYYGTYYSVCDAAVNSNGSFQVHQPENTTAEDYVELQKYDEDGDRLVRTGYDLQVTINKYADRDHYIGGNRAFPYDPVSISIYNEAGVFQNSYQINDAPRNSYGFRYGGSLPSGSTVRVQNGSLTVNYRVPLITMQEVPAENRIYGQAPQNEWVYVNLSQYGAKYRDWLAQAFTESDGWYSASFNKVYPNYGGCEEGRVGGCRQASLRHFNEYGHRYLIAGPFPQSVTADIYDSSNDGDNTPERASVYRSVQRHTFHGYTYDPDWIAVEVPAANVGKLYSFQTLNLGDTIRINMQLYDNDKVTLLSTYTASEDAAIIRWKPVRAGWYYVKVTPRGTSGGDCGAFYDFRVQVEADWTMLIYLNGDSDLGRQVADLRLRLEQVAGSLVSTNIVVLYDGMDTNTGDTWRYLIQPNGKYQDGQNRWYMGELNLGDGNTLADFVRWGMHQYPASHYFLSIIDHGQAVQGLSWDFNTAEGENSYGKNKNFSNSDYIEPAELRNAIMRGTDNGANKIDVIYYDTCLMGLWEVAYQMKDAADYLIFSQNEGWALFPYERYLPALRGKDSRSAAQAVAKIYSEQTSQGKLPYTVSVIDLKDIHVVTYAVDQLARQLILQMPTYKEKIRTSRDRSQFFDSTSDFVLTTDDTFIDLYDFAERIKLNIANPAIQDAATAVQNAVKQAVIFNHYGSGIVQNREGDRIMLEMQRVSGLSIYFPSRSGRFFSIYQANQMFTATSDSQWDEMLSSYYGALGLPPSLRDPDDNPPVIFWNERRIMLPIILK